MVDHQPEHLARAPSGRRRTAAMLVVLLVAVGGLLVAWRTDDPSQVIEAQPAAGADEPDAPSSTAVDPTVTTAGRRGPLGNGEAITLAFVGDMNFEGPNRQRLDDDPSAVLAAIAPILRRADVAVGNLETAVGTAGAPWPGKQFTFQAPPGAIDALRASGLDVVSMANNHGMDHGVEGLGESLAVKRAQPDGFVIGIGGDEAEAYAPFTTVVRGQRIAVISATQVIGSSMIESWTAMPSRAGLASAKRVERLVQAVTDARAAADTVVVFLHWGVEKDTCPSADQRALATALTAAGADVVVGGHAHRVQGAGRLGGALVGYGLGNFLWNAQSAESATTGVLEVTITGRRVERYGWVPARISGGSPQPLDGAAASAAVSQWEALRSCTGLAP